MISGIWYTENYTDGVALSLKVKEHLVSKRTPFQKLDMYETEKYGTLLTLGDLVMTTAKDEFVYHELITHVPLFAHTQPERVLIIGGGDCGTAREVVKHPTVTHVDLVEIDQELVTCRKQYIPLYPKSRQTKSSPLISRRGRV
jgi:spermidine synthase